jgi:hypothetical protein
MITPERPWYNYQDVTGALAHVAGWVSRRLSTIRWLFTGSRF